MSKKLNTWTLSGLMIGPILGSGIIFLPPLAYKALGPNAIWAWIIMMLLGGLFAYVFAKMTILTTSNEGMSIIIGKVLGNRFREMSSNFLTAAVFFGPTAVILTASDFIEAMLPRNTLGNMAIAYILVILCSLIIASGITALGRLVLILSTVTGILLVGGSLASLYSVKSIAFPSGFPEAAGLGHTLLLIFWSIIGWEILGNYVEDVKDPNKTILRAMRVSLVVIISIYLLTTFALQNHFSGYSGEIKIHMLLTPLLGNSSNIVFSILAAGLCICTILMFVGAVARQMTARSKAGLLPEFFSRKHASLAVLTFMNLSALTAVGSGLTTLESIVGIANTFFISNALLGLFAGLIYMKNIFLRISITILIFMLILLLLFSTVTAFIYLTSVIVLSLLRNKKSMNLAVSEQEAQVL